MFDIPCGKQKSSVWNAYLQFCQGEHSKALAWLCPDMQNSRSGEDIVTIIKFQNAVYILKKQIRCLSSLVSHQVDSNSGGATPLSLCFRFGCCSRATDKPWPLSRLSVFILTFLLHVVWLWSKIIGLCSIYFWNCFSPSWQINAPLALRGAAFSEKGRSLQTPPSECEKYITLILFQAA